MQPELTAAHFIERLEAHRSEDELEKIQRYFKTGEGEYGEGDEFMGVRLSQVFALSKEFRGMPIEEIERLLESPIHEVRAGGVSIMDKEARRKSTPDERRRDFFELYLRRHDRINNWDLVDLGAKHVVGRYLDGRDRGVLDELARSHDLWERRTAIVSTSWFISQGDVDDTFRIAEILVEDDHDLIQKATGGWLSEAGKRDRERLRAFLERHTGSMPRTLLRYATRHLEKEERARYR